jgi:hypothetical protein
MHELIEATYEAVVSVMQSHPTDFAILQAMPIYPEGKSEYFFIFDMGIKSGIRSSLKAAQIDKGAPEEVAKMQARVACYHAGIAEIERFGQASKQGRTLEKQLWENIKTQLKDF